MDEKKKKVPLPYFIFKTIEKDVENFGINKNRLCNLIYKNLKNDHEPWPLHKFGYNLFFDLNIENMRVYPDYYIKSGEATEADYFRSIFAAYSNKPSHEREKIVFKQSICEIERAIKENCKIQIEYNGKLRKIEPFFIEFSKEEDFNYLFCWSENRKDYINYRVSTIESIDIINEKCEHYNSEYLKNIKKNFDPFLSYGKIVKVRFTSEGKELFDRVHHNRPVVLENNGEIFVLQCSEKKGQIYFSQFFGKVEILEPLSLREWFCEQMRVGLAMYGKSTNL